MVNWFESWFDSPYYHLLYDKRNDEEATNFLKRLVNELGLPNNLKVLDLACGKGRHSRALFDMGMRVLGLDLSQQSIACARKNENERLQFKVHDMRDELPDKNFDVVFNLFTSFGYFESDSENRVVLNHIYKALKKDGYLIIDFMNAHLVIQNLVKQESLVKNNCAFHITRSVNQKHIIKEINVVEGQNQHYFKEKVQAFMLQDFEKFLSETNFKISHVFGDYNLSTFAENSSPRLILICRKNLN